MITLILIAVGLCAVGATVRAAVLDRPRSRPQSHRVDPDLLPPAHRFS